uniref:Uncharacterized protein n=2 Tax=Aegilops tauschii TaxID=37682 RepID=A0A453L4H1_AEGTS
MELATYPPAAGDAPLPPLCLLPNGATSPPRTGRSPPPPLSVQCHRCGRVPLQHHGLCFNGKQWSLLEESRGRGSPAQQYNFLFCGWSLKELSAGRSLLQAATAPTTVQHSCSLSAAADACPLPTDTTYLRCRDLARIGRHGPCSLANRRCTCSHGRRTPNPPPPPPDRNTDTGHSCCVARSCQGTFLSSSP